MHKNGVFNYNLIMEFKDITILKERICASLLKKNISLNAFFVRLKLKFCAQTKEEEYKCDSNLTW